jgi:hypothetical protein
VSPTPISILDGAERLAATGFGALAALRRGRAVHTRGCGYAAHVTVVPDWRPQWPAAADAPATVRLSRGAGLPDRVPDILGIAVRVHQPAGAGPPVDLLAASSHPAVGLRHVLRPAVRFERTFFSSLLPYALDGEPVVYGFRVSGPRMATLDRLSRQSDPGLRLDLVVAAPTGPWARVATVTFSHWLDDDTVEALATDPAAGGPFGLYGPLRAVQQVRGAAYRASEAVRGASAPGPVTVAATDDEPSVLPG